MSANETLRRPQLVSLPRKERERARPEDFEMIERTRAHPDPTSVPATGP